MKEVWKTIPEWNLYEISNLGNIKGKERIIREGRKNAYIRKERLLKPITSKLGYKSFMFKQDGKNKKEYIHRLVAKMFIPNPQNKPCVNHIDNNPSNNCVDNLEWCTMQENTDWMIKQGRFERTEEWHKHNKEGQRPYYKGVIATNVNTGEKIYFESIQSVKDKGFQPSCVCVCCKNKRGTKQHLGYYWEYANE